jgi:peptidoglycan hydrolase-like protein with peptidoglycan-binding domain
MPLQSKLFSGDAKLEAAAISDAAHITQGDSGDHVRKIQLALSQIDGRELDVDGRYGPATAAAVLAYKQKRKIINSSYQTKADNIVGRMTIGRLDSELCDRRPATANLQGAAFADALLRCSRVNNRRVCQ